MDLNTLGQWVSDIFALLAIVISIVGASRRQNRLDLDRLDKKVDAVEGRVIKVESDMMHLPDKDAAHRLEMAVTKLESKIAVMDERLKPVAAMASRMQEAMIESSMK